MLALLNDIVIKEDERRHRNMNIEILKHLQENPEAYPNDSGNKHAIRGISITEIEALETKYNNGSPFPKVLRELLYLAGDFCYVLAYGLNETQEELQEDQRELMADQGQTISRPFYVLDCYSYGDTFLFIYLDEGDNPPFREFTIEEGTIRTLATLKDFINSRIDRTQASYNPF
jgi:hypothetical protein